MANGIQTNMIVTSFDDSDQKEVPAKDVLAVTHAVFNLMDLADGVTNTQLAALKDGFNDGYQPVAQGLLKLLKSEAGALRDAAYLETFVASEDEEALRRIKHNLEAILPGSEASFKTKPIKVLGLTVRGSMTAEEQISLENRLFVLKALHNEANPDADFSAAKLRTFEPCGKSA